MREKNREACIRDGCSLKARTLLHAYFAREPVPVRELQNGMSYMMSDGDDTERRMGG